MIEPATGPSYAEASKGVMRTRSGIRFSLLNPRPEDVRISDIAEGLSKICRFTGQASTHYSVAEHSVRVFRRMQRLTSDPRQWLTALLHDAAEAYLNDMAKPIKEAMRAITAAVVGVPAHRLGEVRSAYDILEDGVMRAIATRFRMPIDEATHRLVKQCDNEVYVDEVAKYMQPGAEVLRIGSALPWYEAYGEFSDAFSQIVEEIERRETVAA